MIDVDDAVSIVLSHAGALPTVRLDLSSALHRTLAEPVATDIDQPPFDRSLMDGFAVRAVDTAQLPSTLDVVGQVAAGSSPEVRVTKGQAVQINTGAPIPSGADAVARVESTRSSADGRKVSLLETAKPGQFITRRATYRSAGQRVLDPGTLLTPAEIATAASSGAATVSVYRRPRIGIVVTGNELVDIGEQPTGGQIRNTNQYVLEALVRSVHCEPVVCGVVGDDRSRIQNAIRGAENCDAICITGGVSMGEFDFVPDVLVSLGAIVHFHKLAIKPGRPTLFATLASGQPVFGLPGNPVSAFVGFHLLVAPALTMMQGRRQVPSLLRAVLRGNLPAQERRRAYYPARLTVDADGGWEAHLLHWHGSGDALGLAGAQALVMRPPGAPAANDGDAVRFIALAGAVH